MINDQKKFEAMSDAIIANRYNKCLDEVKNKVYSRELFGRDWYRTEKKIGLLTD